MSIQWKSNMAIGVEEIDNQHKELFNAINRLLEACNQGKGKEETGSVIKFLEDYVVTHFSAEQKLQLKHAYPAYHAHKRLHEKFIKDFSELKEQFDTGGANARLVILINRIVVDWLRKHITTEDKALGIYINSKEK